MKNLYLCVMAMLLTTAMTAQNKVGLGTVTPDQTLEVEGTGDQYVRIHTLNAGSRSAGIELIRSTEFSGSDWRIVNDGGVL
jgi:hypothetical protein